MGSEPENCLFFQIVYMWNSKSQALELGAAHSMQSEISKGLQKLTMKQLSAS